MTSLAQEVLFFSVVLLAYLVCDEPFLSLLVITITLEFIEFGDEQVHWSSTLDVSFQHMVGAFTSLCACHTSTKDTHEVWLCPFFTVLEQPF